MSQHLMKHPCNNRLLTQIKNHKTESNRNGQTGKPVGQSKTTDGQADQLRHGDARWRYFAVTFDTHKHRWIGRHALQLRSHPDRRTDRQRSRALLWTWTIFTKFNPGSVKLIKGHIVRDSQRLTSHTLVFFFARSYSRRKHPSLPE